MNIEKAIEILELDLKVGPYEPGCDLEIATLLSLEALKAIHKLRHYPFPDEILQLPGETKP